MRYFLLVIGSVWILSGCSSTLTVKKQEDMTNNPTAVEILAEDQEADIFQYNNVIYVNASNIDWVQEKTYDKGAKISEISKQNMDSSKFTDGTASKLPAGTEVYQVRGNGLLILMIEKEDEEIIYLGLIEG